MALVEKYVSSSAGGSGNGLTAGAPFTFDQMLAEIAAAAGTGKRYNIKADGTYTRTGYDNVGAYLGTSTDPIVMRGYKTAIGDGFLGRTGGNGALITTNMPLLDYTTSRLQTGRFYVLESLNIQANTGDPVLDADECSMVVACKLTNSYASASAAMALRLRNRAISFECDCLHTGTAQGDCVIDMGSDAKIDSCRVITASTACKGIKLESSFVVFGCLIKGNGGLAGLWAEFDNRNGFCRNNTVVGFQDGFYCATTQVPVVIGGNMVTGNSRYGFNFTGSSCPILIGPHRFRDNVTGNVNLGGSYTDCGRVYTAITTGTGDATDYVAAASNDYNLIATSPAKETNTWKNADIGAFQRATGSGGGAAVFNPLAQTIIKPA